MPWYAGHRDLPDPDFCRLAYYTDQEAALDRYGAEILKADAVIVGSYVPDGIDLIDRLAALGPQRLCFYDIDTPVTLAELNAGDEEFLARRQISLFDAYFSFSGGEVWIGWSGIMVPGVRWRFTVPSMPTAIARPAKR